MWHDVQRDYSGKCTCGSYEPGDPAWKMGEHARQASLQQTPADACMQIEYGAECHISKRPYTKFRWRPGSDARYKSTIICQEVAKAKNVCQVCLLDLKHNLPVQVRDQLSNAVVEDIPESDVGLEYQLALKESRGELGAQFKDKDAKEDENLARLTRTTPYYKVRSAASTRLLFGSPCLHGTHTIVRVRGVAAGKYQYAVPYCIARSDTRELVQLLLIMTVMQRNRAQLCSFFARGECNRGAECPYRHEMPQTGELAEQNIRDRYYGINDPVARKMMRRLGERVKLDPPEDPEIKTLYVGNIEASWKEDDLREVFEKHGEVTTIRIVHSKSCAFVTFATRQVSPFRDPSTSCMRSRAVEPCICSTKEAQCAGRCIRFECSVCRRRRLRRTNCTMH